jgi:hypothetical protein
MLEEGYSLESFSEREIEAAFDASLAMVDGRKRPNVAAAKIMALIELGRYERAATELEGWHRYRLQRSTELPIVADILRERQHG